MILASVWIFSAQATLIQTSEDCVATFQRRPVVGPDSSSLRVYCSLRLATSRIVISPISTWSAQIIRTVLRDTCSTRELQCGRRAKGYGRAELRSYDSKLQNRMAELFVRGDRGRGSVCYAAKMKEH